MKALKWLKDRKVKKFEHLTFDQEDHEKVTAVLEVHLHCPQCVKDVKKFCEKIKGIESVEIDAAKGEMTVKGTFDVKNLVERFRRKAKKVVKVVSSEIETQGEGETTQAHDDSDEGETTQARDDNDDISPLHSPTHEVAQSLKK